MIADIILDFNFCLMYSFCVVLISGQLSVLSCSTVHFTALFTIVLLSK